MALDSTKTVLANLEVQYVIPKETFSQMYSELIKGFLNQYIAMMSTVPSPSEPPKEGNIETNVENTNLGNT